MKRWYVIQVYAGYENAVRNELLKHIKEAHLDEKFGQVLIPSIRLRQMFEGDEAKDAQLFPGYLLIEMELEPQTMKLVATSSKIIKFLGGREPVPLSSKEIDRVLSQMKGEVVVASKKSEFNVGSEAEIVEGPFAGFMGIIDRIDEENERLTVMVSIFGRMTPVELGFNQVK
jgi:transcriptional antiterminator NusG